MSVFNLVHPGAIAELPGLLSGKRILACTAVKDVSGNCRVTVELLLEGDVRCHFVAGPLQAFTVEADVALPQFVGAGDTAPPDLEVFKLRAV